MADIRVQEENKFHNHDRSGAQPITFTPMIPYDPELKMLARWTGFENNEFLPWEYNGWQAETLSWKTTAYMSTYLSGGPHDVRIVGPDAEKVMSDNFVNSVTLDRWKVGKGKHLIACSEKGTIIAHGMGLRIAEDSFALGGGAMGMIADIAVNSGKYDVRLEEGPFAYGLVLQFAGPRALEITENVVKRDIHDLPFMGILPCEVDGCPARILRMGMGGTLAYEIHCSRADAAHVYEYAWDIAKGFGAERLGLLAYMCNHTENGFPQWAQHFMLAANDDPATYEALGAYYSTLELRGSMADQPAETYYRNPIELGWGRMIDYSKPFKGREALIALRDDPHTRRICNLEWNPEDILGIFRAYYDTDDMRMPDLMDYPQRYYDTDSAQLADKVLDADGNLIGISSGVLYTQYYKSTISQCVIDPEFCEIGTEVTVLWGRPGTRQIPIRAKVARYPYLDLAANRDFDIESIPRYGA